MGFSPPPPPPQPSSPIFRFSPNTSSSSSGSNFPILAIAIIGIVATAFLLVSYYIFVIKCCLNWHRFDLLGRFSPSRRHSSADPSPAYSPATVSRGLDESLIRLIPVIRFRKDAMENRGGGGGAEETEYLECAVCLSDFKEGEKLRVIPNCCHAFHIDCIDVWLQSNANCPLCRSSISSNTLSSIQRILKNSTRPSQDPTRNPDPSRFAGNDEGFVVIEIEGNNLDEPRMVTTETEQRIHDSISSTPLKPEQGKQRKTGHGRILHLSSMDDECIDIRDKDDVFHGVQPIRRSISMDLSSHIQFCSEIREVLEQSKLQGKTEMTSLSNDEESSNRGGMRRSFFSFGSGRSGSRMQLYQFN